MPDQQPAADAARGLPRARAFVAGWCERARGRLNEWPVAALPALVLGLGCLASVGVSSWLERTERALEQASFERSAARVEAEVRQRFMLPLYGLRGGRGAFAVNRELGLDLGRVQFRSYVESRELATEFPGIRGFGFIERVERAALPQFIARERADEAPDFTVRELDDRSHGTMYVIRYIEPLLANRAARGLDVGSEPRRRAAIELAIDSARPTLTAPIPLVQDGQRTPGFLLLVPLYRTRTAEAVAELRQPSLAGVLYAPLVARELLTGAADAAQGLIDFELAAGGPGVDAPEVVFTSQPAAEGGAARPRQEKPRFAVARTFDLHGSVFTLSLRTTPRFEATVDRSGHWVALGSGLLLSGLLAGLAYLTSAARQRAEALARGMTGDLERLAVVARRTGNAVVITDISRRITWVNAAFERITGYSHEEALGRSPGALLQHPATDAAEVARLRAALDSGQPFRGELLNRSKDGRVYWLELEIQPLRDGAGAISGFMAIESDITDKKTAERELSRQRQRLANILDGTQVGTWEWNVETGATVFDERWAQMVGSSLDALGDTTVATWTALTHPDDQSRSAVLLERHFNDELPAYECELRARHAEGHWVWVLDRGKLFSRSSDGRPRWMAGTRMDVTARKLAEQALKSSSSFLDRTGRIGGVGGWQLDVATGELQWTAQTCRIHDLEPGYGPSVAEATAFFAPDAQPLFARALQAGIEQGEGFDLELPLVTAAGRSIWVRVVGEVETGGSGTQRVVGALQDITQRRRLEAELRAGSALMSTIVENLPCGLSVFDERLQLVASNRRYRELLGFPDAMFEGGQPHFEHFIRYNAERGEYGDADVDAIVQAAMERASAPAMPHRFERVRPNGLPLEVQGAPMPGGGFVTTYTDISERKAAEMQVQRSNALLRGAIDAVDEAFVLYDPDDRLVFCNDKYRQIYAGVADRIVPGARFEDIVRAGAERGDAPDTAGGVDAWVAERVAAHQRAGTMLVQRQRDGRTLRIIERKLPDGHIVGFRIDITELTRAVEAAQEASRAKSQFLANMSHEIRTPMNAVLGMLALLRRTELSPRQADYAAKTEGAARSLLGLLNDILDFSKVEAGKMLLDPQPFELERLMSDLSVILSANVGAKPVELLFDIDPAVPPRLVGDSMRLQQVLINLGGNAVKFTPQGEVVISVALRGRSEAAVTLEFAVRDTGIGIAPENQQRIFAGFTQAEASTTRRFGGTGLGVVISQRMVTLMGGELQLDSTLGEGSRFHFSVVLPVAAVPAVVAVAAPPAASRRVLIVDDNPTALDVLARAATSLGWTTDTAASGAVALAQLRGAAAAGTAYDAVFLDWQMPQLDGWQTLWRMRALQAELPGGQLPKMVMVTASGRDALALRPKADQAAIDGFVVKPVTAAMLAAALDEAGIAGPLPHRVAGPPRLAGVRLLLAEDNPINQQVALELLQDEGASVHIAHHGEQAVAALAATPDGFDLVLMDLQMPVMDGLAATRVIREQLGLTALPVVAMTANAMHADREACLAAGMDEHVGKPFDLDHLVALVNRLLGRADADAGDAGDAGDGVAASGAAGAGAVPALPLAAAQAAGLALDAAVARLGGRPDVYRRMLRGFVRELAELPAQLAASAAASDAPTLARQLHTLKGVAATLGASELATLAAAAEREALADGEALSALAQRVGAELQTAAPALAAFERGWSSAAAPATGSAAAAATAATAAADPAMLRQRLQHLRGLLQESDLAATEFIATIEQDHAAALGARLAPLEAAVSSLDFEGAERQCRELLEAMPA